MKMKKLMTAALLVGTTLSLSSCWLLIGAAAGGGTIAYVQGKYSMNVEGSMKDAYNAALEAVQSNDNFVLTKKSVSAVSASIQGNTKADSKDFNIDIEKLTANASKITIKFGTFGDRAASDALMTQINNNLK